MKAILSSLAMAAVALASSANPVTNCPQGDKLCYTVSVPSSSASSGKGDIFFQIQAPSDYMWAALGQGTQMAGANIFMIYADAANSNITLSPRLGLGQFEPQHDTAAQVELLEGSGIANGVMTANVRCGNCDSWSGGSMSLSDSSSNWIYSFKQGSPADSDSPDAAVPKHDIRGTLTFDLTSAAGGSDTTNPFIAAAGAAANGTGPVASPPVTGSTGGASSSSSSSSSGGMLPTTIIAHGTIMGLSVVLLFPVGALIRSVAPASSIWVHAGFQSFTLLLVTAGAGLGIWVATQLDLLYATHPIIGLVVFSLVWIQPIGGLLQHAHFRSKGGRSVFGWGHRVLGTCAIILGITNGGLGLQLAYAPSSGVIAYVVLASVLACTYIAVVAFTRVRRGKAGQVREKSSGRADGSNGTSGVVGEHQESQTRNDI